MLKPINGSLTKKLVVIDEGNTIEIVCGISNIKVDIVDKANVVNKTNTRFF